MYTAVSRWEALPGKDGEFERQGLAMRAVLRDTPGARVVVHAYDDETAYNRIVNDPNGPFETALRQNGLEGVARWLGS
jgi:hypothetical protein